MSGSESARSRQCMEKLVVVNMGAGLPAALVATVFAQLGAEVVAAHPQDGDPFDAMYPVLRRWRRDWRLAGETELSRLLETADVCVMGGEDYPGAGRRRDAARVSAAHPSLVVLDIAADLSDDGAVHAVEILAQARSGLVGEMYSDRPFVYAYRPATFGAALLGVYGIWAALVERGRSGLGQVVRTSLPQGLALYFPNIWMEAERPDAPFDDIYPKDVRPMIFRCADGEYVQIGLGVPGAVARLYRALEVPVDADPADAGKPDASRGIRGYFVDTELLDPYFARLETAEVVRRLWAAGLAAEKVRPPGGCWDDEQVVATGIIRRLGGERYAGSPITIRPIDAAPVAGPARPEPGLAPLSGVRILDFGSFVAGPLAGRLLADLGADVINVEASPPIASRAPWRTELVANRAKRSISVDAKSEAGRRVIAELCRSARVVKHNFRVGVATRLGLDPSRLRTVNPAIVTLQTSAYGQTGPRATNSGFDPALQALSGIEYACGGPGNPPAWPRSSVVDYTTALLGATAILAGIWFNDLTGQPVETEVDLARSGVFMLCDVVQLADGSFVGGPRLDREQLGFHPAERLYRTASGWIAVAARSPEMAERMATALGLARQLGPRETWDDVTAEQIAAAIVRWRTEDLCVALTSNDVWFEPCVLDRWATLGDMPAATERELVVTLQDEQYGKVRAYLGALVNFSRSRSLSYPAESLPEPGQHTGDILASLGFAAEDTARWQASGVVSQT
jgi:crotonobetainyl-CoA:carnitine CoA-transferase CaiB-like acyl-CoA transferase